MLKYYNKNWANLFYIIKKIITTQLLIKIEMSFITENVETTDKNQEVKSR